jgi:hypothetical protein
VVHLFKVACMMLYIQWIESLNIRRRVVSSKGMYVASNKMCMFKNIYLD